MCNAIKIMESDKDKSGTWGGQRPGSGNKFKWNSGETKAVRIPIAIADEVLEAAKAIDAGKHLVADDCVTHSYSTRSDDEARYLNTLTGLEAANHKLSQEVGALKADLFRLHQQLQQVTKERDDYFDRISDIQLELDNLKDDSVTQSKPSSSVTQSSRQDASTLFNQLRPLLNRLNDRERRAVQQKLEAILEADSQSQVRPSVKKNSWEARVDAVVGEL